MFPEWEEIELVYELSSWDLPGQRKRFRVCELRTVAPEAARHGLSRSLLARRFRW
jgi:hypothetical protein